MTRRYLAGVAAIEAALAAGEELRVLLVERGDRSEAVARLKAR